LNRFLVFSSSLFPFQNNIFSPILIIHLQSEEARDILAQVVLNHIPVENYNFRLKVIYIAQILRRIIHATHDPATVDDPDYYGNKRLEMYLTPNLFQ